MEDEVTKDQIDEAIAVYKDIASKWAKHRKGADVRAYEAAFVTLTALTKGVGATPKRIAELTGIDGRTVAAIGRRLESAGLWDAGEVTYGIGDDLDLQINFLVAEGLVDVREVEAVEA